MKKSTVPGDIPSKLIKHFAAYLAYPFTDIINSSIKCGQYPNIYKYEVVTPVPKVYPCDTLDKLRNISGLLNFDKVMENLISEYLISDMKSSMDKSQFGNEKGTSIQHYLIKMIHRILTAVDKNSQKEAFAVIANYIDWKSAFPRQCHKLGIESLIRNGVRPSLIPLMINYFQDRKMSVKLNGYLSNTRPLHGGSPQGATFGIIEYLSQSNPSADCVSPDDRYKFIDDLTTLEIINLLTIGLSSHNSRTQVPSDIHSNNQIIPADNLKSQQYLTQINDWTKENKMLINEKKTKSMIFNFTDKYKFSTRLKLNDTNVDVINEVKLLGTYITSDLKWDRNTDFIVKKANARMELLRRMSPFGASQEQLTNIYKIFIRSILEQSSNVWHSSLTQENINDLERVQKNCMKLILKNNYTDYDQALARLELSPLQERRQDLLKSFTYKCLKNEKMQQYFIPNEKTHNMKTRTQNKFKVFHSRTERLKKSSIIAMQNIANEAQF